MTKGTLAGFSLDSGACNSNFFSAADFNGGGAYLEGGVISNCLVQLCKSPNSGGGVSGAGPSGAIVDSTITSCTASNSGGGAAAVTLNRCVIYNNWAQRGYGGGTF